MLRTEPRPDRPVFAERTPRSLEARSAPEKKNTHKFVTEVQGVCGGLREVEGDNYGCILTGVRVAFRQRPERGNYRANEKTAQGDTNNIDVIFGRKMTKTKVPLS